MRRWFSRAGLILGILLMAAVMVSAGEGQPMTSPPSAQTPGALQKLRQIKKLDLKTAQQVAVSGNPSIAAAEARVMQARARVQEARAAYWPRLDLSASANRTDLANNLFSQPLHPGSGFIPFEDPQTTYLASLAASWRIFDGFARKFSNAAARYAEQSSQEALNDARRLLLSAVGFSFYSALLARANISIALADENFNRRQVEDSQARFKAGTGTLSDVLNFKVQINATRNIRFREEKAYKAALYGLAALMGLSEASFPEDLELVRLEDETPREMVTPDAEELIVYAYRHRPDLLRSEFAVREAESSRKVARAEYFPWLDVRGSLDGQRYDSAWFEGDDFGNSIGVQMTYNLFTGGATRARVWKARSRQLESEKALDDLRNRVAGDIRKAVAELKMAQEQLSLQRSNTALVEQNRSLTEKEYKAGQVSLVRLNEAQRNLSAARARLALALVSMRLAWHNLEVETGRILATYRIGGNP
jgi:outer membrane protein TolC